MIGLPTREPDPMLRRFQRDQALATLVLAAGGLAWGPGVAVSVVGGGALMATSYWAIKGGVDAMLAARDPVSTAGSTACGPRESRRGTARRRLFLVARFAGRYALLALAAYVMLICLGAHPVGLIVGAASPALAAAVEGARVVRAWSRHTQPR